MQFFESLKGVMCINDNWDAAQEARKNTRGMWILGDKYISPKEWRKQQRE
jgi:endonuclease YncB( thermonuclease family)